MSRSFPFFCSVRTRHAKLAEPSSALLRYVPRCSPNRDQQRGEQQRKKRAKKRSAMHRKTALRTNSRSNTLQTLLSRSASRRSEDRVKVRNRRRCVLSHCAADHVGRVSCCSLLVPLFFRRLCLVASSVVSSSSRALGHCRCARKRREGLRRGWRGEEKKKRRKRVCCALLTVATDEVGSSPRCRRARPARIRR
jgi:hypothetical protein